MTYKRKIFIKTDENFEDFADKLSILLDADFEAIYVEHPGGQRFLNSFSWRTRGVFVDVIPGSYDNDPGDKIDFENYDHHVSIEPSRSLFIDGKEDIAEEVTKTVYETIKAARIYSIMLTDSFVEVLDQFNLGKTQ